MKKIILLLILINLVFSQDTPLSRSLIIYKDNFAVIKEPIALNLNSGKNFLSFNNISKNIIYDSPFLNIDGARVLSQTLNKNFSSTDAFLKNNIGSVVEVVPLNSGRLEGVLLDINGSTISLETNKGLVVFQRSQLISFNLKSINTLNKFSPEINWEIFSDTNKNLNGELSYISSGFSWQPIYYLTINGNDNKASLSIVAEISNNSNVNFFGIDLNVVEGSVPLNSSKNISSNQPMNVKSKMASNNLKLGDFYIYDIGKNIKLDAMQTIQLPLINKRDISFDKKYVFTNSERDQGDEPLSIEVSFENTIDNNLEIPLPSGVLYLYEKNEINSINFIGKNSINQLYKGGTAILDGGKAFEIIGKRRILNFDRQTKSEESTISLQILNTSNDSIKVKVVEKIFGDWVIKESSTMYIKEDASTIYFPLEIEPGQSELITYTYKKEWK